MIDIEQIKDNVYISYYNEKGGISVDKIRLKERDKFKWVECDPDDKYRAKGVVSQYGKPVKKQRAFYLNKYRKIEFLNNLPENIKKKIHKPNNPNKWFMDIETEVSEDGFPDATKAKEKVLTNAFCNQNNDVFITTIKELSATQKEAVSNAVNKEFKHLGEKFNVQFKYYETEALMLAELFYKFIPQMPLLTGWNFIKFDWCFLVNRAKNMGVQPSKASYTGNMYEMNLKDKYNKDIQYRVEMPFHRGIVDYMDIFDNWDTSMKLKSSVNLDTIANEILGVNKISYEGTLMDMYRDDIVRFVTYNAVDSILVSLIDKKLQTFNTMQTISSESGISLNNAQFASVAIESLFSDVFYKNNRVFVRRDTTNEKFSSYVGGYVHEPKKGIFNDVGIVDYESLFPSIMMFQNAGTDTFLGKTSDKGKTYLGKDDKIHDIDPDRHIWTPSGAVYLKKDEDGNQKDSVMRQVVWHLFSKRIKAKTNVKKLDKEIDQLKKML